MNYRKGGFVFRPDGTLDWMHHYAGPVSAVELDDAIRVFFSTRTRRDDRGQYQTRIAFLDCDKDDPAKVRAVHDRPVLPLGAPGTFDEHGTMVADVVAHGGRFLMYYMGWQRSASVPYLIRLGLAVSEDGARFTKISEGPVIGISRFLPFGVGNVSVLPDDSPGAGALHMWYTHYLPWIPTGTGYRPTYDIRYARSTDGLDWQLGPRCIAPAGDNEALATPCARRLGGRLHMWYSYRAGVDAAGASGAYRLGYATGDDELTWRRADEQMTLGVSPDGWDSQMICYPDVLETRDGNVFLFYCGNDYGRDGFGYARVEI